MKSLLRVCAPLLLGVVLLAGRAPATPPWVAPAETPLLDLLYIVVLEHEILALDSQGPGQLSIALELGEAVLAKYSRGKVGVVITDRRMLAVGTNSGFWQAMRFRAKEVASGPVLIGDRVALVTTNKRALGFDGGSSNLIEKGLGPQESFIAARAGENVAVVVTSRRALALSAFSGGFYSTAIRVGEEIESVEAGPSLVTIQTPSRLLMFNAFNRIWEERDLDLR